MVTKDCDKGCRGKHSRKFPFFRNPFVFVVLWLVLAVAIGAIIMLLWNWLMPVIFGLPVLSLWQALGLFVLTRILFGSFGFGRRGMPGLGGNPVHEKWMHMTPEQRREFIKKRKHMGFGPWDRERFFDREDFGRNTDADFGKSADVTQGKDVHIAPSVKNE